MSTLHGVNISASLEIADYEKSVESELTKIAKNPVGSVILTGIKSTGKEVTIVPYKFANRCNAKTRAEKQRDASPDGTRYYDLNGRTPIGVLGRVGGTGKGSSTTIHFTPGMFGGADCFNGYYGSLPDEVLLHEMVHGLRQMQGLSNAIPMSGTRLENYDSTRLLRYNNEEEFLAIVVANVYISAMGSKQLRADHKGHTALQAPLNTSAGFLTDKGNHRVMSIYHLVWKKTFQALSQVKADFNPFQALTDSLAHLR